MLVIDRNGSSCTLLGILNTSGGLSACRGTLQENSLRNTTACRKPRSDSLPSAVASVLWIATTPGALPAAAMSTTFAAALLANLATVLLSVAEDQTVAGHHRHTGQLPVPVNKVQQATRHCKPGPQQCPFCGVQPAKLFGTPLGTGPTLHSPGPPHPPGRAVSAAAGGGWGCRAAAAGAAGRPRGVAATGWIPGAGVGTKRPACNIKSLYCVCTCLTRPRGGAATGWTPEAGVATRRPAYGTNVRCMLLQLASSGREQDVRIMYERDMQEFNGLLTFVLHPNAVPPCG